MATINSSCDGKPDSSSTHLLPGAHRLRNYKTRILTVDKIRSKKTREGIQLRKDHRFEQYHKRRNVGVLEETAANEKGSAELNVNELKNKQDNVAAAIEDVNEDSPLDKIANVIIEGSKENRLKAVNLLRRLLSKEHPPIDDVIDTGVIPHLIDCVSPEEDDNLQMEAAWALTNIASGTSEQTATVVQGGGVPRFIQLIQAPNSSVREQVVWALGNISGDCAEHRDLLLDYGIVPALVSLFENNDEKLCVKRQAAWLLSNLCRHKHSPLDNEIIQSMLPIYLNGFETYEDREILKDMCWGLSYLTEEGDEEKVQLILDSGVLEYIVDQLDDDGKDTVAAIRFVGNITSGTDSQTQMILDCGGLVKLKSLMHHHQDGVKREVCWAISNITAGTVDQKQAVINQEIVPALMNILQDDQNSFRIKKEAIWALSNLTEGATQQQISYLVELGLLQALINAVELPQNEIIRVALDGIVGIIENVKKAQEYQEKNPYLLMIADSPDLVSKIEALQVHENQDIYQKAVQIMDYLSTVKEKEEEEELVDDSDNENKKKVNSNLLV